MGASPLVGTECPANVPDLCTGNTDRELSCGDPACPVGFACDGGQCQINGADSPLEVTLSWDYPEDLDLHVVEPQPGAPDGGCEIWYGNTGNVAAGWTPGCATDAGWDPKCHSDGGAKSVELRGDCNPVGWLDRDSNAQCLLDDINIENVLYRPHQPVPPGRYVVRVDFYEDCSSVSSVPDPAQIPYLVQLRVNGTEFGVCGTFTPSAADFGVEGFGVPVAEFDVPAPLNADGSCDCAALDCSTDELTCSAEACACLR